MPETPELNTLDQIALKMFVALISRSDLEKEKALDDSTMELAYEIAKAFLKKKQEVSPAVPGILV